MVRLGASVRSVVGTIVLAVGGLALVAAGALVLLTTELRRAHGRVGEVIETVRLAEEGAIGLLLHARVGDGAVRRDLEARLGEGLARGAAAARSEEGRRAHAAAASAVEAYLASAETETGGPALGDAFAAVERLASISVREAYEADARVRRLDALANVIGVVTAALLVLLAGWLLWWLRSRAFRPLLALADAMTRFGSGDAAARAPEAGPAELREMAARFNRMAAALTALRERQLTFLAALAHDLRNPLSALRLAAARPAGPDRAGIPDPALAVVRRQVLRLERLVSDFLDTARIEAGRLEVRPHPVDLRPLVEGVVSLYGATSAAHRITARVPAEEVVAACDAGRLEQVLNNLVSNAIKYSPEGGRIDVAVDRRPDAITVSVADEGVGLEDDELDAIFEPFRRGRAGAGGIPGVGLGLYVSKRIVEAHGGHIAVTSHPGRGSTFRIVLPR